MALRRGKHPTIYGTVANWYDNIVGVSYIAHLILTDGTAVPFLNNAVQGNGNQNFPANHPDQQFWTGHQAAIQTVINNNYQNLLRIEIDCSLMPCTGGGSCLMRVPALIQAFNHINGAAIRIFSHRDENMGGAASSKRYVECVSTDGHAACTAAYNLHDGWGWVPYRTLARYAADTT